jgi:dTMP kinase
MRGRFITFEGPEGSGKSTQACRLVTGLRHRGLDVVSTREPGGTRTGEVIRDLLQHDSAGEPMAPETEVLLFAASRAQLVRGVILPALERGAWVVSDRFADSTTAYQGYGRGFDVERMLEINEFAVDGAAPDLTILLDIDVSLGFKRLRERVAADGGKLDRIERETLDFHRRVREGYLELAARWPERFRVVRADAPQDDVQARIRALVEDWTP